MRETPSWFELHRLLQSNDPIFCVQSMKIHEINNSISYIQYKIYGHGFILICLDFAVVLWIIWSSASETKILRCEYNQPIWNTLHWRHNDHDGVSNHQPHGGLLNRLFRRRSKKLAFVWGIHRDRWIPRTKGQLRRKCFHLMTSSWLKQTTKHEFWR